MNAPLIKLYRHAEDYFFRGIASKCLDLGDGAVRLSLPLSFS
jgi:hypothetical protein